MHWSSNSVSIAVQYYYCQIIFSSTIFTPEKYNVKADETSVSGVSSGGYMAVQFHVAFSGTIKGAGITAGGSLSWCLLPCNPDLCAILRCAGPFYCAKGAGVLAFSTCTVNPALIDVSKLVSFTQSDAQSGYIDSTSHMENSRVFLISGTRDTVIVQG